MVKKKVSASFPFRLSSKLKKAAAPFLKLLKPGTKITQYKDGSCSFEGIATPKLCEELVELQHPCQRTKKPIEINKMAKEMEMGLFVFTHDPIATGSEGLIVNGQNRMYACIQSGKPFRALFLFNMSREEVLRLDGGTKRNIADHLCMAGDKSAERWTKRYANCFSILTRLNESWALKPLQSEVQITEKRYETARLAFEGLYEQCRKSRAPCLWAAAYLAYWKNPEVVHAAVKKLFTQDGLKLGEPMHAVNLWMQSRKGRKLVGGFAQEANILSLLRGLKAEIEGSKLINYENLGERGSRVKTVLDDPTIQYFQQIRRLPKKRRQIMAKAKSQAKKTA